MRVLYDISKLMLFVMMLNFYCYADSKRVNFNELQNELSEKKVSDTLIIKSGKFENQVISIRDKKGIVIIGDNIDKVVLTGRIQFIIENSEDIELSNFVFMNTKSKQLIKINNSNKIRILNNLFSNSIGDGMEVIANKSNDNIIEGNYFNNNKGGVSIRYGNNCIVKNNIFINNEQNIRLFGKGHEVYGNYIEKSKFGIRIPNADFSNDDIIDTVGYYQGEDISIHENYFFQIANEEVILGEKFDKKRVLQPSNIKVKKIKSYLKEDSHQLQNRYKKLAENIKDNAGKRYE